MFKTHRKIYSRLKLENIYSVYIFSQFFMTFAVLCFMLLDSSEEKVLLIEALTIFIGIMTYIDILIRMRSKRYFFRSIWGVLEMIIMILLTTIILNLVLRGFRLQTQFWELFLILIRYFGLVLRFFLFFQKSQNTLHDLNSGTVIKIGDFNSEQKTQSDNVYDKIKDSKFE